MNQPSLLVTGASGFIGRELCRVAMERGRRVRGITRAPESPLVPGVERVVVPDLLDAHSLAQAFRGTDAVVHLAARVHVMRETASDPDTAFRRVNVEGTIALASAALKAGIRRFVYVSSVKVNGEMTLLGRRFQESDAPEPVDPYGRSKLAAEAALRDLIGEGLECVVVRPPLVYGPGVGGNILRLLELINYGIPLPLGGIHNQRSLIGVRNLAGLLFLATAHPRAIGETFLAADGEDISTPDLVRHLAAGLGRPAKLVAIPESILATLARVPGAGGVLGRLTGSLQVDATKARTLLNWRPELALGEGLRVTAAAFRERT